MWQMVDEQKEIGIQRVQGFQPLQHGAPQIGALLFPPGICRPLLLRVEHFLGRLRDDLPLVTVGRGNVRAVSAKTVGAFSPGGAASPTSFTLAAASSSDGGVGVVFSTSCAVCLAACAVNSSITASAFSCESISVIASRRVRRNGFTASFSDDVGIDQGATGVSPTCCLGGFASGCVGSEGEAEFAMLDLFL